MILAISQRESGLNPLAVHLNSNGSRDYGLMQISERNFGWLGLTLQSALDPCTSIRAAATVLTSLSRYNTGDPARGIANGYATRVIAVMDEGRSVPAVPTAPQPAPTLRNQFASFSSK